MPVQRKRLKAEAPEPAPAYDFDWVVSTLDQRIAEIRVTIEPNFRAFAAALENVFVEINNDARLFALAMFHSKQLTRAYAGFLYQISAYLDLLVLAERTGLFDNPQYSKGLSPHKNYLSQILFRCSHWCGVPAAARQPRDIIEDLGAYIGEIQHAYDRKFADASSVINDIFSQAHELPLEQNNNREDKLEKWVDRDKGQYKGPTAVFSFILDHYPDLRTTGGLNDRDNALYQAYLRTMKKRSELLEQGKPVPAFPEGFKPLLDKETEIANRPRPTPQEVRRARGILMEDERARKRAASPSR